MPNLKKKPSDYPQFYFRISESDKALIDDLVDQVYQLRIRNLKTDEKLPKRNEIISEALVEGLGIFKKRLKNR